MGSKRTDQENDSCARCHGLTNDDDYDVRKFMKEYYFDTWDCVNCVLEFGT